MYKEPKNSVYLDQVVNGMFKASLALASSTALRFCSPFTRNTIEDAARDVIPMKMSARFMCSGGEANSPARRASEAVNPMSIGEVSG